MGQVPGTRELVLAPLPYVVIYRLREDAEILAVMHGARDRATGAGEER